MSTRRRENGTGHLSEATYQFPWSDVGILAEQDSRCEPNETYPIAERLGPVLRVALPRARCLTVPGGTVHVVGRCTVQS